MNICICIYTYTRICMYIYAYIYILIYIYISLCNKGMTNEGGGEENEEWMGGQGSGRKGGKGGGILTKPRACACQADVHHPENHTRCRARGPISPSDLPMQIPCLQNCHRERERERERERKRERDR